jgi:hypothetical protein
MKGSKIIVTIMSIFNKDNNLCLRFMPLKPPVLLYAQPYFRQNRAFQDSQDCEEPRFPTTNKTHCKPPRFI